MKRRTEMVALLVLTVVFSVSGSSTSAAAQTNAPFLPGDETEWKHSTG